MALGGAGLAAAVAMAQVREAAVRVEAAMVADGAEGRVAAATEAAMAAMTAGEKAAGEMAVVEMEDGEKVVEEMEEGVMEGAMARGDAGPAAAVAMAQGREAAVRVEAAMVAERAEGRAAAATAAEMGE